MALAKNISVKAFGKVFSFENAYHKVDGIFGSKESLNFKLVAKTSKDGEILKSDSYVFVPNLDGKNFIAQAYDYLKSLPEFSSAIDC